MPRVNNAPQADPTPSLPGGNDIFVFRDHDAVLQIQFQPKLKKDGTFVGAEVLLRDVTTGKVPSELLQSVRRDGTSHELNEQILKAALRECKLMAELGVTVPVAVNIHPDDFTTEFTETVKMLLRETELDATLLELEVTEDEPLSIGHLAPMHALTEIGVRLTLDDFGTGHANEAALFAMPDFHTVKIAKEVLAEDRAADIAVNMLARGYVVIVEGVETQEQLDALPDDCIIQGFGHGGPAITSAALLQMLQH